MCTLMGRIRSIEVTFKVDKKVYYFDFVPIIPISSEYVVGRGYNVRMSKLKSYNIATLCSQLKVLNITLI